MNIAGENTSAEEDSESPLAKRARTSPSNSRDDTLPQELQGLTEKDYSRIISVEVVLDKDHSAHGFEKGETYSMAMSVASKDGNQPAIDISKLHLSKLRRFARNFGMKMTSKMPSAVIRIHLAKNARIASILDVNKVRSVTSHDKRKQNTIVRLVNVLFSERFISGLKNWNDRRTWGDHEIGVGGNNMGRYFVQIHSAMYGLDDGDNENRLDSSDAEDEDDSLVWECTANANDPYALLNRFEERTDVDQEKIKLYYTLADLNPGHYMKMRPEHLQKWTNELLRARKKVLGYMKQSGEHNADIYNFVRIALQRTCNVKNLGEFPLYYFCMKAESVPDFDKKCLPAMDANLKGDTTLVFGKDDEVSVITGGHDTSLSKQEDSMQKMASSLELIQQSVSISSVAAAAASQQELRVSRMKEAEMLERRLGQSEGFPLRPNVRARMQAYLNKIYDELYGPAQAE
ncbi:hypothetical protein IV203_005510 [Nitzschia inconspicua]|uniref:Uncharacterized protein n=1 Tax=Nitzschia inconspicua TaxID=303405 RepID=A0A9K3KME8_9STRA|nr:hypothetical protein IV203_005510 [Nitzschia inconspicua]